MAGPGVWMKVSLYGTDEPGRAFQVKSMWSTSAGITWATRSLIRLDKHPAVCIHHTSPFKVVLSRTLRIELDDNWRSGESNHSVISICKQGNCRWFKHPHKIVDNQKSDLNGALNHSVEKREVKIEIASAADFNIWI